MLDSNIPASAFTLFDILTLGSIVACVAMSAMRGIMAEVIAFGGWLISIIVARALCYSVAEGMFPNLQPYEMAVIISFVLIFVCMRIMLYMLNYALDYFIKVANLTYLNRFFGGVVGLFKGLLIVSLTVLACSFTSLPEKESWQTAKTSRFFEHTAQLLAPSLPDFLKQQVSFPPRMENEITTTSVFPSNVPALQQGENAIPEKKRKNHPNSSAPVNSTPQNSHN